MDGRKPIGPNGETMSALSWPSHLLRETESRDLFLVELSQSMVRTVSFHSLGKTLWTARFSELLFYSTSILTPAFSL